MLAWLTSLFGTESSQAEEAKKHAEEERRKAEESSDDGETKEEAVDPSNPASTPGSREQDVRDEVHRALLAAHAEVARDSSVSPSAATDENIDDLKGKMVRGETDSGVIAMDLHQQAEIRAEIDRFAMLNSGLPQQKPAEIEPSDIADNLQPNLAPGEKEREQKNQNWNSHPAGFLQKKPIKPQ